MYLIRLKILQKVTDQLDFQYLYHFRSLNPIIFKILTSFAAKMDKNEKMRNSHISLNFFRGHSYCSNWLRIAPDSLWMIQKRFKKAFLKICISTDFMLIFHQKNSKFHDFLVKNQHKIRKNQNFQKSLLESLLNHPKTIWCKFQPI